MPLRCRIRLGSGAELTQLAAGFTLLQRRGLLEFDVERTQPAHSLLMEVRAEDAVLLYDATEGYDIAPEKDAIDHALDGVTLYFKRNYERDFYNEMKNRRKLRPLGLFYDVTCTGNFIESKCPFILESYMSHNSYPNYKAMLVTQLLDPKRMRGEQAQAEAERVNALRLACIRACKTTFGERFFGGLEPSAYAKQLAPELVLPAKICGKDVFLQRLKENYICIATEGVHHSAGKEIAAYTAAGRAIVTQPLYYTLPGSFCRGKNYLVYHDAEACVRQAELLLSNVSQIHRMEAANFAYYNGYVRPDAMVLNSLRELWPERFPEKIA